LFRISDFEFRISAQRLSHLRHIRMRPWDDVDGEDFADAPGGFGAGVDRGADGGYVTFQGDRDQPAADLVLLVELHVGRLERRVAGLDGRHDAFGFD
jgi:hypothetical protein